MMKKGIYITYKNGREEIFEESNLDCSQLTVKGHASKLIEEWMKNGKGVYVIDRYNAILLDEIISVRVV